MMLDCSRNAVMSVQSIKKWIDVVSDMGYNTVLLYLEDTYEVDNQPYFGYLRGRYSHKELWEIDDYAASMGMEIIPCIQTLAHLKTLFHWPVYEDIHDCEDILLAEDEKTYALIEDMFATVAKTFRTKTINIGMDEAHMLGLGKYLDKHGFEDRFEILQNHMIKVAKMAEKYDFELLIWGDMFFRLENKGVYYVDEFHATEKMRQKVPHNVQLIYWDYYSTDKKHYDKMIGFHKDIKDNIWFGGGMWSWIGHAPRNAYSIQTIDAAVTSCIDNDVKDVFFCLWGDDGAVCSKFALLPSLYYAAELAKGNTDVNEIKGGFAQKFGISFDEYLLLDLPDTASETNDGKLVCPDKYMLFSDCLMGAVDSMVSGHEAAEYASCARKLEAASGKAGEYAYLFDTIKALCDVLAIKYDLGVRTYETYRSNDRKTLETLLEDYDSLLDRINTLYDAFKVQWMRENKPQGFEVQDIRFGGLIYRVKHCKERVQKYISSELSVLEELEESRLDYMGNGNEFWKGALLYNRWGHIVTANTLCES